jgi:hypothetical protein
MKNPDELITEEGFSLKFQERESEEISIDLPKEALISLEKIAKRRDMSLHALLKFYIGQNLRHDLATLFAGNVLEKTEEVLSKHLKSKEEVSGILNEIKHDLAA